MKVFPATTEMIAFSFWNQSFILFLPDLIYLHMSMESVGTVL